MSTTFLGLHKNSFREFDPIKHLLAPKIVQGSHLFIYKAAYEAAALKKDSIRTKAEHEELKTQSKHSGNVHLTKIAQELNSVRGSLTEERTKVKDLESTCIYLEDKVQQLTDAKAVIDNDCEKLQVAIQDAQRRIAEADGQRRIIANLNASLTSQSSLKQALHKKMAKTEQVLQGKLREAAARAEDLEQAKAASERIISCTAEELAEVRREFENDKCVSQAEIAGLHKQIADAEVWLEVLIQTHLDISQELRAVQQEFTSSKALYVDSQKNYDALFDDYATLLVEKQDLEIALSQAQLKIEQEMANAGEALTSLHLERKKTEDLEARLANSSLEREKIKSLESQLAESNSLLAATKQGIADVECELNGFQFIEDHPHAFEVLFDANALELELERDMYKRQEQDALAALEAERKLRLAIQAERDLYYELQLESREAHQTAHTTAEKERDSMASQLEDALAKIAVLTAQVQREGDINTVISSQLSAECEAHATTRDGLGVLQIRLATMAKDKDVLQCGLQDNGQDLEFSPETHHSRAAMQTRFRSATNEDPQALIADLAKENVALKASKRSVEIALASKVEHCEVLDRAIRRLHVQYATSTACLPPTPRVSAPAKAALVDKENSAPVSQVAVPPRSSSIPFGGTLTSNTLATSPIPSSKSVTGTQNFSSSGFLKYFTKKNVPVELTNRNVYNGATSGTDAPALY